MTENTPSVCVIIPTFNEVAKISTVVESLLPLGYQVVVVDDGSTDDILSQINTLPIAYLRHLDNLGQGAAIKTGLLYSLRLKFDYYITFDADGQHQARDLPLMVTAIQKSKLDILLGSRFLGERAINMSAIKRKLLQLARIFNYLSTGLWLSDAHNGLRILNHQAASAIQLNQNRMAHATEILAETKRLKLNYGEFPVQIVYTAYSKQKGQHALNSFNIIGDLILAKIFN
ncbi:glycosyltransferase family 2 protein [Pedobacter sp. HDW13]|uniref:glycosyltransferase family 2 protein n=1 Tax=unclassified Pedobacter TaxID=2628915 RepID=UPI000F590A3F|nr:MULTISPECIES: glycosyltransferase family 2 protein [unclassified Pedobacter]QIL38183.1 glycosyltransferase family 2 protein [Pedobacter sp. HDW13]RQO64399.1 glycosyltransferase family 2 protein [Pedobacter sp. KBW01]